MQRPLNTVIILGSSRAKRIGGTVANYVAAKLEARATHKVSLLDPRTTEDWGSHQTKVDETRLCG